MPDLRLEADKFQFGDRDLVEQTVRQLADFAHGETGRFADRQRGEQRAVLEQHAPAPFHRLTLLVGRARHVDAEHLDRRPRACG